MEGRLRGLLTESATQRYTGNEGSFLRRRLCAAVPLFASTDDDPTTNAEGDPGVNGKAFSKGAQQSKGSLIGRTALQRDRLDHKTIGATMDLFCFPRPKLGSSGGLGPALLPRGQAMMLQLQDVLRKLQRDQGFQEVRTGSLAQAYLWDRSGHLKHFAESMYAVTKSKATHDFEDNGHQSGLPGPSRPTALRKKTLHDTEAADDAGTSYLLKPMSCPLHLSLFLVDAARRGSALPLKISEFGHVFRREVPSALNGLLRMREFTQDDGHILCRVSQATTEFATFISTCLKLYKAAGFRENDVSIHLSTRPESSKGSVHEWAYAEGLLRNALEKLGFSFTVAAGDGAFYGPKVDLLIPDAFGRLWQTGTLQVDLFSPLTFGLDADAPASFDRHFCLLHRAMCGSLERFLGLVVEHSKGNLPFWLAPTQVAVLTVGPEQAESAECLARRLRTSAVRVSVDTRLIHLSRKLKLQLRHRTPEVWLLGNVDRERNSVTVRRPGGRQRSVSVLQALASARRRAKPPL
ncbi:hypothetical protein Esti_001868 [Eimeria stiedai]